MKFIEKEVVSSSQPFPVQIKKPACLGIYIPNCDYLPLHVKYGGTITGFYICSTGGKWLLKSLECNGLACKRVSKLNDSTACSFCFALDSKSIREKISRMELIYHVEYELGSAKHTSTKLLYINRFLSTPAKVMSDGEKNRKRCEAYKEHIAWFDSNQKQLHEIW
jgi:hypothetical protein